MSYQQENHFFIKCQYRFFSSNIPLYIEKNLVEILCKILEMELKIKFKVLHYIQHDFFRQRVGLSKDQASYNLGQNILELYNVLVQVRISISKTKRDISVTNLLQELPNDLRLRILGKRETVGNSQIWCPVFLPETKLWQQQSKSTQKQILSFSCPVNFYRISQF